MRFPTLVQAVADGASAAGCVLFALIATGIGTAPLAIGGLALLGLSAIVRVVAIVWARRRLALLDRGRGAWTRWIHALWIVQCLAFVAGLVLAHSSVGAVATAAIVGVVVAVTSVALAGGAARRAGRGSGVDSRTGFVDSAAVTAYA
ncbi:hypothetical protein [Clavibacter michiganensis]|uniref:hypothetical protein n=1 Tax=Clavibacter michiganensis TaxID=28447 RepID=UPI000A39AC9D|nr:hypothetical protein [Clavibacter michiganensis]MBE3077335.1 hypothetical protein [Clavibacter michiganensis subsp. michiganensis]MDO4101380.1 hypothetical protein [Clavibacter michiganensis]MDO4129220.1 hypothetical protein [Clavibacter michiganensis]NIY59274.1 hypothetical protein [Clavibacter michiganensis subsp. michiganensis]OUE23342.1 hypothetical protein CMMCA001_08190 [Clavibacter michiganensis subsp. michiganensis]